MATIKPISMPHGAKITFDLKFGGSSVSCAGMIPSRKESRVVLRASTDNGKTWTEIETWKGDDFKYILNEWNNMEFALTKWITLSLAWQALFVAVYSTRLQQTLLWALGARHSPCHIVGDQRRANLHRSIRWSKHGDVELPVKI